MGLIHAVFDGMFRQARQTAKPPGERWPVWLFHVDTGGCGGCGMELQALAHLPYDLRGAGFGFVETPRAADVLLVTGAVTWAMAPVLQAAWDAMPTPKGLITVGACAQNGGPFFAENYAVMGGLERKVSVDFSIPGCPPTPADVLAGLSALFGGRVGASAAPAR